MDEEDGTCKRRENGEKTKKEIGSKWLKMDLPLFFGPRYVNLAGSYSLENLDLAADLVEGSEADEYTDERVVECCET